MSDQRRVTVALGDVPPALEIHDEQGVLWGWEADPGFLVVTDDDRAGAALEAAVPRLSRTGFGGYELGPCEQPDGTEDTETPHSVSPPSRHEEGWSVHADTQSNMTVKMRDHMVRVLVEELERFGVTARIEQF